MTPKEKMVKRVLWEHSIMYLCIVAFGIFAKIIFPTMEGDPGAIRWKYETARFAYEVSPLIILLGAKALVVHLLDFFCLKEREKIIVLFGCTDNIHTVCKDTYSELLETGRLWRLRVVLRNLHITDIDCQVAHKYQIKMLRFSHLVVDIKEVTDDQALKVQLDNILGLIEQQQEEIELCQFEIHEQQRKYAIQYQKYTDAADEQKKDVHLSMMRHIGNEIDDLNKEKEKQEDVLKTYQLQKMELEQQIEIKISGS